MITIKTSSSKIINPDGGLATGFIIIAPNASFEYTEGNTRRKVTQEPIQVLFSKGLLSANGFTLAPTLNADHDKSNLYYTVLFVTNAGRWTEYWVLDATGGATLDLADIVKVIVNQIATTEDFVSSDDTSIQATPLGIPRAKTDGTLDLGWLGAAPGSHLVLEYVGTPPSDRMSIRKNGDQIEIWNGSEWRVVG